VPDDAVGARSDLTVTAAAARVVSTVPAWSVRSTSPAWAHNRSIVAAAGWPYVLPAPTDTTATPGRRAASNSSEDAVPLPW
jgi:hypothetical protein